MWVPELASAVAWPIAAVVIAHAFKANFIDLIPAILKRKWEFEVPGWFKAKIDAAEQQQGKNPTGEKLAEKAVMEPSPRVAVDLIEKILLAEIESIEESKKEAVLLRSLALTRLEAGHEFCYNRIFGSQIGVTP